MERKNILVPRSLRHNSISISQGIAKWWLLNDSLEKLWTGAVVSSKYYYFFVCLEKWIKPQKTKLIYLVSRMKLNPFLALSVTDKMKNNNHLMRLFFTFFRGVLFNKERWHLYLLFKEFKEWTNFDNAFRVYAYTVCVALGAGTSKSVSRIGYRLDRWWIFSDSRW
jgi:hypothetical protein